MINIKITTRDHRRKLNLRHFKLNSNLRDPSISRDHSTNSSLVSRGHFQNSLHRWKAKDKCLLSMFRGKSLRDRLNIVTLSQDLREKSSILDNLNNSWGHNNHQWRWSNTTSKEDHQSVKHLLEIDQGQSLLSLQTKSQAFPLNSVLLMGTSLISSLTNRWWNSQELKDHLRWWDLLGVGAQPSQWRSHLEAKSSSMGKRNPQVKTNISRHARDNNSPHGEDEWMNE